MRINTFIACILISIPTMVRAENLLAVYELALCNDPLIQAARETQLAAREAYPQARALFFPVLGASYSGTTYDKTYFANHIRLLSQTFPLRPNRFNYEQNIYSLTLTQPIFYYEQWQQLDKAEAQVKQANANYAAAEQDLILRTIQRYIAVLRAFDTLKYAKTQYDAFAKIFDQTEQRYKAGVINTITDLQIARAKRDNAYAAVISSENNLIVQKKLLQELTCFRIEKFQFLKDHFDIQSPEPKDLSEWVEKAQTQNLNLMAAQFQLETLRQDIKINKAGHLPSLNLNGAFVRSSPTKDIFAFPANNNSYIGLQVAMPLFSGGSVVSKTTQARHLYEQSYQQFEALHRQVESSTTEAYLGVLSQMSQISAYKTAIASNQTALEGTRSSVEAGSKYTIVDILSSESDLIKAKQDYANARYDYILQSVQLKQAAGILCPEDILQINAWLK